jgi:hypothetical protein
MRRSRLLALTPIAVGLALLLGAGATSRADSPKHESLAEIMARWKAFIEPLRNAPREVRVPESKRFFATISWEDLDYLCHEGSSGVGPDSTGILAQIMTYRLQVAAPTASQIAAMVANHDQVIECRSPLVAWVSGRRDSMSTADRALLAGAFRSAATFPGLPIVYLDQLLEGVAGLVASDSLMSGMMAWARAANIDTAAIAVRMLSQACDPRAPDSLAALAAEFRAAGSPRLELPLIYCRGRCGELALPVFVAEFEDSTATPQRMSQALEAAGNIPTLPAAQAILARYRDGGVIVDSTFAVTNKADLARYYSLWLATRIAEPHLTTWLRLGTQAEAETALELFDRSFRFGPADHDSLVTASLDALAQRSPGPLGTRAAKVHERSIHPPNTGDRRPAGTSQASPPEPGSRP